MHWMYSYCNGVVNQQHTAGIGDPSSIDCLLGMDWAVIGSTGAVPAAETVLV